MNAAAVVALLAEVIASLPAAITTGQEVLKLVNEGYHKLAEALGDRDVSPAEIDMLVKQIVANSVAIQAIE